MEGIVVDRHISRLALQEDLLLLGPWLLVLAPFRTPPCLSVFYAIDLTSRARLTFKTSREEKPNKILETLYLD